METGSADTSAMRVGGCGGSGGPLLEVPPEIMVGELPLSVALAALA